MLKIRKLIIFAVNICAVIAILVSSGCEKSPKPLEERVGPGYISYQGYSFVKYEGEKEKVDSFLACGTGGRIDRIFGDGTVEHISLSGVDNDLTDILTGEGITVISGYSGTMLYSRDGQTFNKCEQFTDSDLVGLTSFKNNYFAAARDGKIYLSNNGESWQQCAEISSDGIVSIAATGDYISAITAKTDIFMSTDGINWELENFNDAYDGYYEKYVFTSIASFGRSLFILGYLESDPGVPNIMFSDSGGEVWLFRVLSEINGQNPREYYPLSINQVIPFDGEMLAICNKGRIATISSCAECNLISEVSQRELHGIALNSGMSKIVVVGDNFAFEVLNGDDFREKDTASGQ